MRFLKNKSPVRWCIAMQKLIPFSTGQPGVFTCEAHNLSL